MHLPVVTINVWKHIDFKCNKIGILHETDVNNTVRDSELKKELSNEFTSFFARSNKIKNYFDENSNLNVNDNIIYSGINVGDEYKCPTRIQHSRLNIIFVGKLIQRKIFF